MAFQTFAAITGLHLEHLNVIKVLEALIYSNQH